MEKKCPAVVLMSVCQFHIPILVESTVMMTCQAERALVLQTPRRHGPRPPLLSEMEVQKPGLTGAAVGWDAGLLCPSEGRPRWVMALASLPAQLERCVCDAPSPRRSRLGV